MGGIQQSINYTSNLTFIQKLQDSNFGQVQIYRNQDGKFIMKNQRSFLTADKRYNQFKSILQFVDLIKSNNKNIAQIKYIQHFHQSNVCLEYEKLFIFTEYLNFTLKGLIIHKKQIEIPQLWYCIKSLLQVVRDLEKHNLKVNLTLDNVFLNLKGIPIIFLYHMMRDQRNIHNQRIDTNQSISLNIQQQRNNYNNQTYDQFSHTIYRQKKESMYFNIALIVLQLSAMQQIIYNQQQQEIQQIINNLIYKLSNNSQFKKNPVFLQFLQKLLFQPQNCSSQILIETLDYLSNDNIIQISNQIRFNKFKYVLPQEQKQKQKKLMKNLTLDQEKINQNNLDTLMNSYKTPIYRLNQKYNSDSMNSKGKDDFKKAFFSATNTNKLDVMRKKLQQDQNLNHFQKNLQNDNAKKDQIKKAYLSGTRNRINSMTKMNKVQILDQQKQKVNNQNLEPTISIAYQPISFKPRKKTLSVTSVSQRSSDSAQKRQSLELFDQKTINYKKFIQKNQQRLQQKTENILRQKRNVSTEYSDKSKLNNYKPADNSKIVNYDKSNLINLLKLKTQVSTISINNQTNSLKNSSIVKLSSTGLDQKGFLESLQLKKQQNQAKIQQMILRKNQLEKNFKKIKNQQNKNQDQQNNIQAVRRMSRDQNNQANKQNNDLPRNKTYSKNHFKDQNANKSQLNSRKSSLNNNTPNNNQNITVKGYLKQKFNTENNQNTNNISINVSNIHNNTTIDCIKRSSIQKINIPNNDSPNISSKNNTSTLSNNNNHVNSKSIRQFCKQKAYMNSLKSSFMKKMVG